jgi:uncharacterized protein
MTTRLPTMTEFAAALRREAAWRGVVRAFRALLLPLALCLITLPASALEVPPLRGPVSDLANVLSEPQRVQLEQRLKAFESQTGHQFALLTLPSLEGDALESYSIRVVEAWRLGDQKKDDGLLLLIAVNDRKVRIEVGYGLEGEITDVFTGRVIREVIAPKFRQGEHAQGISDAFGVLMKAAGGEGQDLPQRQAQPSKGPSLHAIVFGLVVLLLLIFGRGSGTGLLVGALLGSGLSGGSRGGGGGGYRGRGGGFGGGGASGGW